MGDIFGGIIFFLTFYILFQSRVFRRTKQLFLSSWLVLMATQTSTITNEYLTMVKGADGGDHTNFFNCAATIVTGDLCKAGFGDIFYVQFLANIFKVFGSSSFLGSELTVLTFIISCYFLLKISKILNLQPYDSAIILLFGLLPSGIIIKSIMLRESYQVLFFIMTVYWGLKFQKEPTFKNASLCTLSGFLMSLFHYIFGIITLFTLVVMFFWNSEGKPEKPKSIRMLVRTGIAIVLGTFLMVSLLFPSFGTRLGALSILIHRNPLEHLVKFRENSMQIVGRATYSTEGIDISSWDTIITGMSRIVANYFFYPYPWKIRDFLDFYGFLENMWRFFLLVVALRVIFGKNQQQPKAFRVLFLIYCFNSFLWALGTTNYGTAIRHHLVGYWILVLIGTPWVVAHFNNLINIFRQPTQPA